MNFIHLFASHLPSAKTGNNKMKPSEQNERKHQNDQNQNEEQIKRNRFGGFTCFGRFFFFHNDDISKIFARHADNRCN